MSRGEVDDDLAKGLQQAKKKPRNFVIIAKGANVLKLLVDKKPIRDGAVTKAKKECQGNVVIKGVVGGGDGPELVFQVAEEPSLSEVKLRGFITDQTKLSVKPRFEVTKDLREVDEDGDEASVPEAPTGKSEVPPEAPPDPKAPSTTTDVDLANRLKALKPDLDKVLAGKVSVVQDLKSRTGEFALLFRNKDLDAAGRALDQVEQLVKQGLAELRSEKPDGDDAAKRFTARLKVLLPALKKAADSSLGEDAQLRARRAGELAREQDFVGANKLLDQVEVMLKVTPSEPPPKLDFPSLWKAAKSDWETANEAVDGQIAKLQVALKQTTDSDLQQIAEFGLNAITAGHKVQFLTAVREVDQSTEEKLVDAASAAQEAIDDFIMHLESDERGAACDANPFKVPMSVRSTLSKALTQMSAALDAVGA